MAFFIISLSFILFVSLNLYCSLMCGTVCVCVDECAGLYKTKHLKMCALMRWRKKIRTANKAQLFGIDFIYHFYSYYNKMMWMIYIYIYKVTHLLGCTCNWQFKLWSWNEIHFLCFNWTNAGQWADSEIGDQVVSGAEHTSIGGTP